MSTADFYSKDAAMDDEEEEGSDPESGVDLMNGSGNEDSSEEEDDDSDAEREVREGFIVDEDESSSRKRRKKKRRKEKGEESSRKRRKDSDDDAGDLDEDDLALLEENTGVKLHRSSSKHKLKRLRRRRSGSADSDAAPTGINNIFDDDREDPIDAGEAFDADEMAGFIEDDTASESSGRHGSDSDDEDEEERAERRRLKKQKKKEAKKAKKTVRRRGFGGLMVDGITAEALQEVQEVFGNGHDYDRALELDEDEKEDKALKDVFEPSEIASRMLTEDDDRIRAIDIPERMQLASIGLPAFPDTDEGLPAPYIPEEELDDAVTWMSTRILPSYNSIYLLKDDYGAYPPLHDEFLAAIKAAIRFINIDFLEVPFIVTYRNDYFAHFDPTQPDPNDRQFSLLNLTDIWRISALSVKYRAFLYRRSELRNLYDQLEVDDVDFETMFTELETVEDVADLHDWLGMRYSVKIAELKAIKETAEEGPARMKRASRESRYETAKQHVVSKLAELAAMPAAELSKSFLSGDKSHDFDDPQTMPLDLAEQYAVDGYSSADVALKTAHMILVHELSRDPNLKKEVRRYFKNYSVVTVAPTAAGKTKIDEMHPYFAFKYLRPKPNHLFLKSPQFLQILAAQNEGLVTSHVLLPPEAERKLLGELKEAYRSDGTSSVAEAWNEFRDAVLEEAVKEHLMPAAAVWARNYIQEEAEDFVGNQCYRTLHTKINVSPYCRSDGMMQPGEVPTVLAISHGAGDPKRDSVVAVYLDGDGIFREHLKLSNFQANPATGDTTERDQLVDLLRRRRPQVLVVGGFSSNTKRLFEDIQMVAEETSALIVSEKVDEDEEEELTTEDLVARARFEMTYVYDDVARIYQTSKRAAVEFPDLSTLAKYCIALGRYAQSPLNEYAALGVDLTAITHDPLQNLLSKEKVQPYLERALIEVVNQVGVDINAATRNPYYGHLLPYVSGLGPRKATSMVQKINTALGGTLSTRNHLVLGQVTGTNVFLNVSAFLRIRQDDIAADLKRNTDDDDDDGPDILDDTRIHPEDYEVARKMAADAIEWDEEDIEGKNKSAAVEEVMNQDRAKLDDLSLDDFAAELSKILGQPKRMTLYRIREEMQEPFSEFRQPFAPPSPVEVFTMLTGETASTLNRGFIIPVRVVRVRQDDTILVRLDSGVNGTVAAGYRSDHGDPSVLPKPRPGETLQALVMDIRYDTLEIELSTQESPIQAGDLAHRRVPLDPNFDMQAADADRVDLDASQKKASGHQKRLIKHPNFHNFSAGQAEEYLTHQSRGECVVRPSSKEDHLAITWKVDEGLFQHIAVFEMNKMNDFSIGSPLKIGNRYSYVDLDELIHMHIRAMAKKVEEMLLNDKCKGTQAQLDTFLRNFTMANPDKSAYGFGLDKKNPGQFVVSFRTDAKSEIMSWPVKVHPGAYTLLGEDHGDVLSLCNAFKTAYLNRVSKANARLPAQVVPGRTPNPYAGRTPNPYAGGASPAIAPAGGRTPAGGSRTPRYQDNAGLLGGRSPYAGRPTGGGGPSNLGGGATPAYGQGGGRTPMPASQQEQQPYR